jgi:hypothetical protein
MLSALLFVFSGCTQSHIPEAESASAADPSAPVSQAPVVAVEIPLAPSEPSASAVPSPTPTPVPTPEPTPEPTPTPVPTPTPDPFRPEKVTFHPENEAFWYGPLTDALKEYIIGSTFPEDPKKCPVKITDLRYVSVLYVDFDDIEHTGALIVHKRVVDDVLKIFYKLYKASYPLASVNLLDDYGEAFDDNISMAANNTSAFCCRPVTGTKKFSKHAYGVAIDINPMMNPYIRPDGSIAPENSRPYLDRKQKLPGMIDESDYCYKVFTSYGWKWGGHFKGETDYQHFYKVLDW